MDVTNRKWRTKLRKDTEYSHWEPEVDAALNYIDELEQQVRALATDYCLWAQRRIEDITRINELEKDNEHLRWLLDQETGPQGGEA